MGSLGENDCCHRPERPPWDVDYNTIPSYVSSRIAVQALASCLTAALVACSDVTDCYAGSISALYDVNWNTAWM